MYGSRPVRDGDIPLVVCCVFKNEAPYLKEWIEFHLACGFEKIYLIDNDSTDNFRAVLEPFIERGVVYLKRSESDGMNARIQAREYNAMLPKIEEDQGEDCWVAFLDVDEYLFSVSGEDIGTVLRSFEGQKVAAVLSNWLMFGTSGHKQLEDGKPMIEQLTRRAPLEHNENGNFKPIAYLVNIYRFFEGPHRPIPKFDARFYYSDGSEFDPGSRPRKHFPLRINHYWYRSEDYYYNHKRDKRKAFGDVRKKELEEWHIKRCNEVEDREILKQVTGLNKD